MDRRGRAAQTSFMRCPEGTAKLPIFHPEREDAVYKTIILHADASRNAATRMQLAALIAEQQQAHLVCSAMTGISRYVYGRREPPPHGAVRADLAQLVTARARKVLLEHARLAGIHGIASYEERLVSDDAYGGLVLQSRYADLLIIGQADRDDPATGAALQDLPEYVILNGCHRQDRSRRLGRQPARRPRHQARPATAGQRRTGLGHHGRSRDRR